MSLTLVHFGIRFYETTVINGAMKVKSTLAIFLVLNLMLPIANSSTANGWRGIVPLHSTRADVERLLGPGTNECKCGYYLEDVNVFFDYSSGDCRGRGSGGWDIQPDTVLRITVYPKPNPLLSSLKIDESKLSSRLTVAIERWRAVGLPGLSVPRVLRPTTTGVLRRAVLYRFKSP
jgi:hypothetical protein